MNKNLLLPARTIGQAVKRHSTFAMLTTLLLLSVACFADPPVSAPTVKLPLSLPADFTSRMVSLSFEHAPMSAAIADLAKQSGHNIVVNDEPRDNQADLEFKGSTKDALDKVAEAYDYTWKLGKSGAILMTKRFSRQMEYPPLNAQELNQTARDILAILQSFNFDLEKNQDENALGLAVYESLTPEQTATLRAGKTLHASQLSDAQKQRVAQAILGGVLSNRWYKWTLVAAQTQLLAGATPDSYAELIYFKPARSAIRPEAGEQLPAEAFQTHESFHYVMVNKRREEQELGIYAAGMMVVPAGPPRRAGERTNGRLLIPFVPPAPLPSRIPESEQPTALPQGLASSTHLNMGATTLKAVTQALSAQTGLRVQTETYLEERNLVVELKNVTAQNALDSLAELNDWRWFSPEKGVVMLTRKRAPLPQSLSDLPVCMSAALPADYRVFLGVGVPKKDLPPKVIVKPNGEEEVQPAFLTDFWLREDLVNTRLGNLLNAKWKRLRAMLLADVDTERQVELKAGKTLAWKPLSPAYDAGIRDVILLNTMSNACQGDISLLNNGLTSCEADINLAELSLYQGNGFMIGSSKNGVYRGSAGAAIPGLKSTVPKLPTPAELAKP